MVIQPALLEAVQLQPLGEVMLTLPLAPSESNDAVLADRSKLQSIPVWVIVSV